MLEQSQEAEAPAWDRDVVVAPTPPARYVEEPGPVRCTCGLAHPNPRNASRADRRCRMSAEQPKVLPDEHVCGPTGEYYLGDPQPPQSAGYGEFVEWQEAQFRKRKRPVKKIRRSQA